MKTTILAILVILGAVVAAALISGRSPAPDIDDRIAAARFAISQPGVGDRAPEFELADQTGQLHSLEDYRDQWVVLYFYPKNETPGCTTEACEFRDNIFEFRDMNAQILGVSIDSIESHRSFAENHSLPFPLLADVNGSTADAYGVKTRMLGMTVAKRHTFLIAPGGNIARHYQNVQPAEHSAQVIADLKRLSAKS